MHFLRAFSFILIFSLCIQARSEITESQCSDKNYSSRFAPPKDQGGAGFCYSFAASDLLSEAIGLKPPDTSSAFYTGSQYVSMSQAEVARANKGILFEDQVLAGSGAMMSGGGGIVPVIAREHNPSGKPFLKREGGQTDLIVSHLIAQGHTCLEKEIPSQIPGRSQEDGE